MSETSAQKFERIFRENRRYSGDGLPSEPTSSPLPIGDPTSGPHNPSKSELRGVFVPFGDTVDQAIASAAAAAASESAAADSASAAATSASNASASEDQAALAAIAAGAPIVTALTDDPVPANDTIEILQTVAGLQVYEVQSGSWELIGWIGEVLFDDVAALLASTLTGFATGHIIRTREEGFAYEVVTSGEHVTTAGGVKLKAIPNANGVVNVRAVGAIGDGVADDSAAYRAASAACGDGGTIFFPPGTYLLNYEQVDANRKHVGTQWLSIIKPQTIERRAALTADSGSASAFVDNVSFQHLRFESMATPTFSQQQHLVTLNGCSNWVFEECEFSGWRGDALYLGSSDSGGANERHNKNIFVIRCRFDGVNNENRQAISAIDVDGLWVLDSEFLRCTKSTMPGVIDLEPNSNAFHIIKNVWVVDNKFDACGGNVGTVAVFLPVDTIAVPTNIFVINNVSTGSVQTSGAGFFTAVWPYAVTNESVDSHIRIRGNRANGGGGQGRGLSLRGVRGLVSEGNTWEDFAPAGLTVGNTVGCRDITIRDTFRRCGSQAGSPRGAEIFIVDNLDMEGSVFDDCGDGTSAAAALNFKTGTSSGVKLNNITIASPTGKTTRAVLKDAGHTFTPATNQHFRCGWGALFNGFESHQSDTLMTAYTPIVEGATTPGTGTYTRQFGRWRRVGRQVFFEIEIVQTAHDGSGLIEISLPIAPAPSGNNELKTVPIMLDGVSTTGGQIGGINPAAVAGGVTGSIRCYHTATGTVAATAVPSGAATYRAAGTYMAVVS